MGIATMAFRRIVIGGAVAGGTKLAQEHAHAAVPGHDVVA